jgi:hypothetical protein
LLIIARESSGVGGLAGFVASGEGVPSGEDISKIKRILSLLNLRKEEGRRKEEGGRRKEEGGRRKEEGGGRR